ncbi:MFS transporter superfamily [Sesbania bispinosa]|nr:MFS transporter superfamily [Sesbania bispinosa]
MKQGEGEGGQRPASAAASKNGKASYSDYEGIGEKPSRYELQHLPTDPVQDWLNNHPGMLCSDKEIHLYSTLTNRTITVSGSHFSSLEWTSIAWAAGLFLAAPTLAFISFHLNGQFQTLITAAATGFGVFFCLPAGFFKTTKIFIPYIAAITLASTVASASHTNHLGLMIHAQFGGPSLKKTQFSKRQGVFSWLSLYATAFGCLGSAIISSFIYHMLREPNDRDFFSLWIVSIFSGLIWLVGVLHAFTAENRTTVSSISFSSMFHLCSVFKYPHAIGGLFGVFLSSFATMCIFTGGVLFVVGQLCVKPVHLLYFWLTYFLFPLVSLPLLQPLQKLIKANSVKMKIMGFLLSLFSSGFGFYFWDSQWKWGHILLFGAIQGMGSGILHAFGRVLVLECAPPGKEGTFSVWYAWMKAAGLCVGFTVGSVVPGKIRTSFGAAFCAALVGIVVLLFGNVSDVGGAVAAGHVKEDKDSERGSNDPGLDSKESVSV